MSAAPRGSTAATLGLVVMITWTVVVKYLVPILWGFSAGVAAPIMWDFWPVAHALLLVLLLRRHPWAWIAGISIGAIETGIVVWKLVAFALAPERGIWKLLWATNKLYVLAYFVLLLIWLLAGSGRRLRRETGP